MSKVCKISVTPDAEKTIGYVARVSNPNNQENPSVEGLIKYCIKNQHWSIFEQAHLTVEINTTRAIAAQILRHRSFTFQEFSQRYADSSLLSDEIPLPELRRQDTTNRQKSIDDLDPFIKQKFEIWMQYHFKQTMEVYQEMLEAGVAKECARMILPMAVPTRIYMTGSVRSWMHYIDLRTGHGTQKEHMDVAEAVKKIFICEFPTISRALDWCTEDCECHQDYDPDTQPCIQILP